MTFLDSIGAFWKNCFKFEGRASRSEFWYAQLFLGLMILTFVLLGTERAIIARMCFELIVVIPTISLTVRRFNDIKMPIWIPIVCGTIVAVLDFLNWENVYYSEEEGIDTISYLTSSIDWFIAGMCVMPSVKDKTKKVER